VEAVAAYRRAALLFFGLLRLQAGRGVFSVSLRLAAKFPGRYKPPSGRGV
jgi:hypothetical protein